MPFFGFYCLICDQKGNEVKAETFGLKLQIPVTGAIPAMRMLVSGMTADRHAIQVVATCIPFLSCYFLLCRAATSLLCDDRDTSENLHGTTIFQEGNSLDICVVKRKSRQNFNPYICGSSTPYRRT